MVLISDSLLNTDFFSLTSFQTYTTKVQEVKQTKTVTETMRVVDDDGNIIKTGDPDTDAVGDCVL